MNRNYGPVWDGTTTDYMDYATPPTRNVSTNKTKPTPRRDQDGNNVKTFK